MEKRLDFYVVLTLALLAGPGFWLFGAEEALSQITNHTIYVNANQDADFTVLVGSRLYTKSEALSVEPNIKSGRPGDPFKGWKITATEPTKKYVVTFKPLQGFYVADSGDYVKEFDIPAGYDYFTYQTNVIYEPTEISVWTSFSSFDKKTVPFTITGPATYQGNAGSASDSWKKEKVPWGTYTITWSEIPGYITPSPETKEIRAEPVTDPPGPRKPGVLYSVLATGKASFAGLYRAVGSPPPPPPPPKTYCDYTVSVDLAYPGLAPGIHVASNANRATFTIKGPETFSGEGNIWAKENPLPGTYTITWGAVSGCTTPLLETKVFKAGDKISFVGNYTTKGAKTPPPAAAPRLTPQESRIPSLPQGMKPVSKPESQAAAPQAAPQTEVSPRVLMPAEKPKSVIQRVFQPLISFFKKIFGGGRVIPKIIPVPFGKSGEGALQGLWRPVKLLGFDPASGDFKEITQTSSVGYTEFKGNQVCDNGRLDAKGNPEPCANYKTFTVKGDELILSGQGLPAVTWKITGDKLELTLEPPASQGQPSVKFKILLERWR